MRPGTIRRTATAFESVRVLCRSAAGGFRTVPDRYFRTGSSKRLRAAARRFRFGTITLLMLFSLLAAGCGRRAAAPAASRASVPAAQRKGRIIALTDEMLGRGGTDTVRFGHLRPGEIAVQRIWLANDSSQPVVVASCARSCGCTTLEFDSEPVAPGDAQRVTLTFDSRGERGWQLKTLDIRFAGSHKPLRLFVEAEVE